MLLTIALALLPHTAFAAGFQAKTMRAPLATTEVERPLIIGRGWLEVGLGADVKDASGYWTDDGQAASFLDADGHGAHWLYTTERLDLRYGVTRHAELYAHVPFHYVHLGNDILGTDTGNFGLGDPVLGWKIEWFRQHAPTTSVITDLHMKMPSGGESPGSFVGGPNTVSSFPLSTGTADLGLELAAKRQFGPFALTAGLGYTHKFSGVAQYVIEVEEYQFLGRFKPGDELRARVEPTVQAGPIAVGASLDYRLRGLAATGTTSDGLIPDKHLTPIDGSDGWSLDVAPVVTANITRGFDLSASVGIPLRGEDLTFFPFEELTPTRGITYSGTLELRY